MTERSERLATSDEQLAAQAGAEWARNRARACQLERLAKFRDDDLGQFGPEDSGRKVAAGMCHALNDRFCTGAELADLLGVDEGALDEVNFDYVRGFIYGALRVQHDEDPAT